MYDADTYSALRNARVAMEAALSRRAAIATPPGAVVSALLMQDHVETAWLIGWTAMMTLVALFRIPVASRAMDAAARGAVTTSQHRLVAAGIALSSLGWGIGTAAGLAIDSPTARMIMSVVLVAITAMGIAYVMDRTLLAAFLVPLVIPPVVVMLTDDQPNSLALLAGFLLFLIVFSSFADRYHRWIGDMLRLNIENRRLLARQASDADHIRHLVAELTATNDRLQRSLIDSEAANDAKSRFLGQVSHELRTPLNAILGYAEIIRDRLFGADEATLLRYSEQAGYIHRSGLLLKALIDDLLDVARIESGRAPVRIAATDLWAAVDDAVTTIRPEADARRQTVTVNADRGLPLVAADPRALAQILNNLLTNAIKFTPDDGHVWISAHRIRGEDGQPAVALTICDDGIGIPAEAIDRVFHPFERGANAVRRNIEGTGLGLSISRGLAEAMGGRLAIEPGRQQGAAVTVTLHIHDKSSMSDDAVMAGR
ncbi:hypothetical protein GCM10011505_15310 [Tistrella bauzanensis]|uniref:histidine kinase n=1 Tax=Tistrella bauzanensis TaxID=657419 RepID=A0ABQ1IER8_9PROT|nr:HAMP domain-containing sensor histidine kinase [Tistrella bauzanensis]GGB34803.1 hypothetical protein GCM10011505_15310 [Tistrella bauzanensis]